MVIRYDQQTEYEIYILWTDSLDKKVQPSEMKCDTL